MSRRLDLAEQHLSDLRAKEVAQKFVRRMTVKMAIGVAIYTAVTAAFLVLFRGGPIG